jgi:hypothetical protein
LTLHGHRPREVEMQWYNWEWRPSATVVLWPTRGSDPVIVVHEDLLSAGGVPLASTIGDIDGDGRPDLAFVAQSTGDDDGGDEAPFVMHVIMTSTPTVFARAWLGHWNDGSDTTASNAGDLEVRSRWRGRIGPGSFRAIETWPGGGDTWTATLQSGVFHIAREERGAR